jgi:DNA polymerase
MPEMTPHATRDLLAFHLEAGVDCALGDAPVNLLESAEHPAPLASAPEAIASTARPARPSAGNPAPPAPDTAIQSARDLARNAATLDDLRTAMERFDGCALKATASRLVFADGTPGARVMVVGEAPGRDEDEAGLPFVGRSGKLLDRMLAAIGLERSRVYIANVIPWRPPGNRTPTPQETQICLPFIRRQIELADPDLLVCLGNPATQTLLDTRDGIMKTRGRWFDYATGTRTIRALPTFHPAYLLRTPTAKRQAWQDMLALRAALDALPPR